MELKCGGQQLSQVCTYHTNLGVASALVELLEWRVDGHSFPH